jgi:NAD(P)-dependent dehydrogenase (short-subunit alcohol dehydrogenase family)
MEIVVDGGAGRRYLISKEAEADALFRLCQAVSSHSKELTLVATKGAVDTLTMALAEELGPRNIRVIIMSLRRVWLIPKATEIAGLSAVKREMREHRRRRSARDSANRRKLRRSSFSCVGWCGVADRRTNQRFRGPALKLR